ncbi:MAG: fatty acid desaturase family protein [Hyphomonadaceae bacterium]|nr:MAG: fatty acid desaturase [Caulobacteraceae bacterium]MBT9445951.1 fatty acid desaturase family protein [Hyphomonadaceae bacterium]TPW08069.1 MAG: fatty acid desaturase [Alphaproteobacteria bacterium]
MPAVSRIDPRAVFTPEEWAGLTRRSSWMGFALVAHAWALIIGAGAMFIAWPNPVTFALAVMVIGARQLGLAILMHDGAHGALHPDAKINEFIGEWLCAAPVGSNLQTYRKYHLKHHRYTEQPEDPDLMLSRPFPITRGSLWRKVVRDMTGQTFFQQRFAGLFATPKSGQKKALFLNETRKRFFAFNALLLLALSLAGYWWAFFVLWLLPMATWMQLILRIRNIGEHAVVHATDDPFHHARTTLANPVERLLLAPYWVHFHAEHHLFMHVPCWNLEKAHRLLMEKGYGPRMVLSDGYSDVLALAATA